MSSALRETVRVSADHSIVIRHPDWDSGEELEVLVRAKTTVSPAYSFLDVLKLASLATPEDYSTTFEQALRGESA